MDKQDYNISKILKNELNKRNNPTDLKSIHIGTVVKLSPLTITIYEGKVVLIEDDNLFISEWFRFRCNIDKTSSLSDGVPSDIEDSESKYNDAKNVTETHSYTGTSCNMPSAIDKLAQAIAKTNSAVTRIKTELLQLKCNLQVNDLVTIGSLEQLDRFILLDKVLNNVS